MAPNPNECVVVLQMHQSSPTSTPELSGQMIKIVTSDVDSTSEDGEHFYDASSDIGASSQHGNDTCPRGGNMSDESGEQENSNKADSGIEDATFEMPDAQLAAQIVEQVEFYFSDVHILKDAFLLKHARRNRDGFISLKLITSFKKVPPPSTTITVFSFLRRNLAATRLTCLCFSFHFISLHYHV